MRRCLVRPRHPVFGGFSICGGFPIVVVVVACASLWRAQPKAVCWLALMLLSPTPLAPPALGLPLCFQGQVVGINVAIVDAAGKSPPPGGGGDGGSNACVL